MRAHQTRWTNHDDPDPQHQKNPNEHRPNFFDFNVCPVTYDRQQVKTERAETDGRSMGSPLGNAKTTPRRAPAVHDANTEPSTRSAYDTSAQKAGQAWKRARSDNHGPRATVPSVKMECDATDGSYTPDTSYDSSPRNDREESPTGAAMAIPLYTLTGSGVTPDT